MRQYPILWKRGGKWCLVLWNEATNSIVDPATNETIFRPSAKELRTMGCVLRAETEAHTPEAVAIADRRTIPVVNMTLRVAA